MEIYPLNNWPPVVHILFLPMTLFTGIFCHCKDFNFVFGFGVFCCGSFFCGFKNPKSPPPPPLGGGGGGGAPLAPGGGGGGGGNAPLGGGGAGGGGALEVKGGGGIPVESGLFDVICGGTGGELLSSTESN